MKLQNSLIFLAFLVFLFGLSFVVSRSIALRNQGNLPPTASCGITSCHGLDISCGTDVPEMCTEEYRLGDFCRQYAQCQVNNGSCEFVDSPSFQTCKTCVQQCEVQPDPMKAFECENNCRQQMGS